MMSTVVLDLAPDLDAILARMRSTTRNYVRQGQQRGITIREGGENDIGVFEDLLVALCQRRGVTPNIPLGNTLLELWRIFESKGHLKLFLGEREAKPVAALLLFTMGSWARAWRVGWSGLHERARPNELLCWECIKWAKLHGYRFFDFVGFDTRNARALMEGRKIPADEWCGASFFKLGFGGTVLPLYPAYCYFYNPVVRLLFDTAGRRLLDSKTIGRLLARTFAGAF